MSTREVLSFSTIFSEKYFLMKRSLLLNFIASLVLTASSVCAHADEPASPRERVSLNAGWRFYHGDPQWMSPQLDYASTRAWLLPSSAPLLGAGTAKPARPTGTLGSDLA